MPFTLLQQLHGHGGLAGDNQRVVIGRDEGPALGGGKLFGKQPGLIIGIAMQHNPGVETPDRIDLDLRRRLRHYDGCADIHFAGSQGNALGMVAGGRGDHAILLLLIAQGGDQVIGAA